ncbi:MAG: 50S ribosomal protein L4 [Bacteroidia bacterium]|nr:50S ribosomal protein L4 [Bacteroidia bacterium]MBN4052311.1 50S ribosomal protein L4 [Sphingobacteriaceae bacterium AH-315-L07]
MELPVLNIQGQDTGRKAKLSDSVFCIEPNDHVVYLAVRQFMANGRQGTAKTRERSEIRGSNRKLRKQKGSGMARVGSFKSPILRGGGRAFGPRPRDYNFKLNKKVKALARKSALAYKVKDQKLLILEDFQFETPKTKQFVELISNLNLTDNKILLVLPEKNDNIRLSQRNLQKSKVVTTSDFNTYDIMSANYLVLSESSVSKIEDVFDSEKADTPKTDKKEDKKEAKTTDNKKSIKQDKEKVKTVRKKKAKAEEVGA